MASTVLGPKALYLYNSDTGHGYAVKMRKADGDAMGNATVAPNAAPAKPSSLHMRHVWAQAANGARRKLFASSIGNTNYQNGGSLTIDGVAFTITGRVGERDFGSVVD